ncbi:MAG: 4Fe-4S binding protein [Pseudomonadota bacterium]
MTEIDTIKITACRGFEAGRCRFGMPLGEKHGLNGRSIVEAVRAELAATQWDAFIRDKVKGALRHHHSFNVALSACPNGCSRPHVADIGLIRAVLPSIPSEACNACGLCINQCPDKALHAATIEESQTLNIKKGAPLLDLSQCMACGLCVRRCPERALGRMDCSAACDHAPQADGWRIVLGGCLGRHPRLATPLAGIHDSASACAVAKAGLQWYMQKYSAGLRFARLVEADAQHGAFLLTVNRHIGTE